MFRPQVKWAYDAGVVGAHEPGRGSLVGGYRLLAELGRGGMGVAYIGARMGAEAGGYGDFFVIKRPHAHLLDEASVRERFYHEASVAVAIRHPNLVKTVASGEDKEGPYIILEYVHGVSLGDLMDRALLRRRPLPLGAVVQVILQSARGLVALHSACDEEGDSLRAVHRDICPENVLVGMDGQSRLSDFGVAKSKYSTASTDERDVLGKLAYLPPEYLKQRRVSPSMDIYSLGITFHQVLLGRLPFAGDSAGARLRNVMRAERVPLTAEVVPPELRAFLDVMCDADWTCRPSASAVVQFLELLLARSHPREQLGDWVSELAGAELSARMNQWHKLCTTSEGAFGSGA